MGPRKTVCQEITQIKKAQYRVKERNTKQNVKDLIKAASQWVSDVTCAHMPLIKISRRPNVSKEIQHLKDHMPKLNGNMMTTKFIPIKVTNNPSPSYRK